MKPPKYRTRIHRYPGGFKASRRSSERRQERDGETRRAGAVARIGRVGRPQELAPKRPEIGRGSRPIGAGRWYTAVVAIFTGPFVDALFHRGFGLELGIPPSPPVHLPSSRAPGPGYAQQQFACERTTEVCARHRIRTTAAVAVVSIFGRESHWKSRVLRNARH
jgi:hypothetical protein